MEKLIKEYYEKFGDYFPLKLFMGRADEAKKEMKKCIRTGKPYDDSKISKDIDI